MMAAICDDEPKDRAQVVQLLEEKMKMRHEPLEITCFDCGEDLVERYREGDRSFDLIFLDIYMDFMDGMEAARQIRECDRNVALIFLTSSPDYAMESYEVQASGYLLKPIVRDKLEAAVNRFLEERYPRRRQSLLVVKGSTGRRISYDDILYIESHRMNLRIVCAGGVEHTIRKKLEDVWQELDGGRGVSRFLKCNQGFIVNMDYITYADTDFTMENGDKVPIKVRERSQIREQYFKYVLGNMR